MTNISNLNSTKPKLTLLFSLILAMGFLIFSAAVALADDHIHYVDADAAGDNSGTSWSNAYTDLQDALDVAVAGDEIWVADGVYKPSARSIADKPRSVTFELIEGVKLYGGFAGSETSIDERNWETNLTILSGDIDNNDTDTNSNNGITTHFDSVQGSNAYNVVIGNNSITYTNSTVLDGFTITGGQTEGGGGEGGISDGPGIRFFDGHSPILRNLHIIGHKGSDDGGGIYFHDNNDPIIENVIVENTSANDFGAGIMFFWDNNPTFKNVSIIGTEGRYAAGIYLHERNTAEFVNFYACGNVSTSASPNGNGNAGTAISFASDNVIQVSNAAFAANVAGENGGAIRMRGNNDVTLTNVTMAGNQATNGGGIHIKEAGNNITIANSILWGNDGEIHEGASATINTTYSIVGDGSAPSGTGNVTSPSSPFIIDPTNGTDNTWGTADDTCGMLELNSSSSAVDAGSNALLQADRLDIDNDADTAEAIPLDLNNQVRVFSTAIDMGAYEFSTPRMDQTITFNTPADNIEKLVNESVQLEASSSSSLPVTFESLTPSICTLSDTEVTLIAGGLCLIRASQTGNDDYNPAPQVTKTIVVNKLDQEIEFTAPPDNGSFFIGQVISLVADASSGLAVTFASNTPSTCSVSGQTAEMLAMGSCVITASQAGNGVYNAASSISHTINITGQGDQTINIISPNGTEKPNPGDILPLSATATSGLPVSFMVSTPSICVLAGSSAEMLNIGTCIIVATQAGSDEYNAAPDVNITILVKRDQALVFPNPPALQDVSIGDTITLAATADSSLPISYTSTTPNVCQVSGNTAQIINLGTCTIEADQAGNNDWFAAPTQTLTFVVGSPTFTVFLPIVMREHLPLESRD